jgi:hypothetical protein
MDCRVQRFAPILRVIEAVPKDTRRPAADTTPVQTAASSNGTGSKSPILLRKCGRNRSSPNHRFPNSQPRSREDGLSLILHARSALAAASAQRQCRAGARSDIVGGNADSPVRGGRKQRSSNFRPRQPPRLKSKPKNGFHTSADSDLGIVRVRQFEITKRQMHARIRMMRRLRLDHVLFETFSHSVR